MAITSAQIVDFLLANPGLSDAQIVSAMEQYGVSPAQMAAAVGLDVGEVISRVAVTVPEGQTITLGDTRIAPQYEVRGSGEDRQVVGIENITVEKTTGDINYKSPVGSEFQNYSPTGEFTGTGKTTSSGDLSFFGGLKKAFTDPVVLAALAGGYGAGLFGGAAGLGAAGAGAAGTTGSTAAQLAAYDLALGGAGGTTGATSLAGALTTGATVPTLTNLTGGSGLLTGEAAGITAQSVADKLAADAAAQAQAKIAADAIAADAAAQAQAKIAADAIAADAAAAKATADAAAAKAAADAAIGADVATKAAADAAAAKAAADAATAKAAADAATAKVTADAAATLGTTGKTAAELAVLDLATGGAGGTAGATSLASALSTGANVSTLTNLTGGSGLLTGAAARITAESVAAKLAADAAAQAKIAANAATAKAAADAATAKATADAARAAATTTGTGLTAAQIAALLSGGLNTGAGLLQQQTSAAAATKAQTTIDAETAAAKLAAQFKPVGMTTRFGTSQFQVDPKTGQFISAGYTLSPEAKNAQDRLVKLAESGLLQAESAQTQFKPLLTAAGTLATLGQGYLAEKSNTLLGPIATSYLAQSPESKNLTKTGGDYLTQSAESKALTALGSKYIALSPEDVAKNYLTQQMALLQPGRELELANLQNRLQQQGRGGLSVAQGGSYGATTPELQALYNARAMQEAQLAANAQQAGQQQVQFGAGLVGTGQQLGIQGQQFGANLIGTGQQLGIQGQQFGMDTLARQQALEQQRLGFGSGLLSQGAGLMGQYYGGQQAAYSPYTNAMAQIQALEASAQQPFNMSAALAQQSAQAGANVGRLGQAGAEFSTRLATGPAATTNPYSTLLSGLGASQHLAAYFHKDLSWQKIS